MSDVKRYTTNEAYALLPYGAKVIAEVDYDTLLDERDQLRAELEAIRGQQPDAVSVPRELLEHIDHLMSLWYENPGYPLPEVAAELRALLSTKNAEEGE